MIVIFIVGVGTYHAAASVAVLGSICPRLCGAKSFRG